MSKLILMSIVIAMVVIPVRASREKDARKGLKKMTSHMLMFGVFYVFALRFLWGRFD
jgi:hypothetical protein